MSHDRRIETLDGAKSSNVHWARYNLETEVLEVDFKNSKGEKASTYAYDGTLTDGKKERGFPVEEWRKFQEAASKGEHFAYKIRPRFKGHKIDDGKRKK